MSGTVHQDGAGSCCPAVRADVRVRHLLCLRDLLCRGVGDAREVLRGAESSAVCGVLSLALQVPCEAQIDNEGGETTEQDHHGCHDDGYRARVVTLT